MLNSNYNEQQQKDRGSFWEEFIEVINRKETIIILVSVLVSTLATQLSSEFKPFSFEPSLISFSLNLFLLVIACFGLSIALFFIVFELLPSLISSIIETFKEKVEKH